MFDHDEYNKTIGKMTVLEFRNEAQKLKEKRDKLSNKAQPLITRLEEIEELYEMEEINNDEYLEEKQYLERKIDKIFNEFNILLKKMDIVSEFAEVLKTYAAKTNMH